jgi:hypothetical protein
MITGGGKRGVSLKCYAFVCTHFIQAQNQRYIYINMKHFINIGFVLTSFTFVFTDRTELGTHFCSPNLQVLGG